MKISSTGYFILAVIFFAITGCQSKINFETGSKFIPVNADSISFAIIGDFGYYGNPEKKVADMVKNWDPDFIITTGDNSYTHYTNKTYAENVGGYYCDFIYNPDAPEQMQCDGKAAKEKRNMFFPVPGNHDYELRGLLGYLQYFTLPGAEVNYDFKWGPVHFFAINSGENGSIYHRDSEVAQWLRESLKKSTKQWKIVYFHHSPFSPSHHGNNSVMQWPFEQWGASMVITGHDHVYSRISKKDNPDFYYIINGVGGSPHFYSCDANLLDKNIFTSICYNISHGAIIATATEDNMVLKFYSVKDKNVAVDSIMVLKN